MTIGRRALARSATLLLTTCMAGCLAAAAAGAGGAIVFTGHTAEAIVDRPVPEMASVAEETMRADGIDVTDTRSENSGAKRTFEGEKDGTDVTVTIQRTDEGTKVGVVARKSAASWDDDYARSLLAKIIE
jgi:methylthioribose-1-phosphate isomerase